MGAYVEGNSPVQNRGGCKPSSQGRANAGFVTPGIIMGAVLMLVLSVMAVKIGFSAYEQNDLGLRVWAGWFTLMAISSAIGLRNLCHRARGVTANKHRLHR